MQNCDNFHVLAHKIVDECQSALDRVDDNSVSILVDEVERAQKVFFIGVGRVMLSLKGIAKRLAHLGIEVHIVGDINEPPISPGDLLIAGSGSGESLLPVVIAQKAKALGARIAWIGSDEASTLATLSDLQVRIPVKTKAMRPDEYPSIQPMTSLFEQALLLLGDTMALMLIDRRKLLGNFYLRHANLE